MKAKHRGAGCGIRALFGLGLIVCVAGAAQGQVWQARHGLTPSQYQAAFEELAEAGYRLVQVDGYDVGKASRYAAIWEKTRGPAWVARHGLTGAQYQAAFEANAEQGYRLVLVDGHTVGGRDLYAAIWEKRSGPAWVARHGLSSAQYQAAFEQYAGQGYRLVHVSGYGDDSARYAAIWEKREGPPWVAHHGLSAAQYQQRFDEHGAQGYRLVHVDGFRVGGDARYAAIWEKRAGPAWVAKHGLTGAQYQAAFEAQANQGFRLVRVSGRSNGASARYAAIWVDAANAETARLRELLNRAYDDPRFGGKAIRGFLVKRDGGGTLAALAANVRFQPLSTLKLLPYLHAVIEVDDGAASMSGTTVSWVAAIQDDPATKAYEPTDQPCLAPGAPGTQPGSAPLEDALPTLMWESHGRTLDAVFKKYPPAAITARAHALGLTQTEMHPGCPTGGNPSPWAANRTTLYDLARLFEGVTSLGFVSDPGSRDLFFDNMINLTYSGASYESPITGRKGGPAYVGFLRDIVEREAGPGKQDVVEDVLREIVIRKKGGSGGPSGNEFGYSDFRHVTLPFKQGGRIVPQGFVLGWYVYGLSTPPGCPEEKADKGPCQAIWQPEREDLALFATEIHAAPIRMALATW